MSLLFTPASMVVCCSCEEDDHPHAHIIFSGERKGTKLFTPEDVRMEVQESVSSGEITQFEATLLITGFRDQAVPEMEMMQQKIDAASSYADQVMKPSDSGSKKILH